MPKKDAPTFRFFRSLEIADRILTRVFSPVLWLGGAGFVLGGWATYEWGLPIYSAIIGLALGLVLGAILKLVIYADL